MWSALHAEVMREFWQPEPWGVLVEAVRLSRKTAVRKHGATRASDYQSRKEYYKARYERIKSSLSDDPVPESALTRSQRAVVVRSYKMGKRTHQIASRLGVSDAAVRHYLSRRGLLRSSDV